MDQNILTFQNCKLTVDYISLNLPNGINQMEEIAHIFNTNYFFDSYLINLQYKDPTKKPFLVNHQSHQLVFAINSSQHRPKTVLIQFPGKNARHLYNLLKSGEFYWPDFDHFNLVLGRFDIKYIRPYNPKYQAELLLFYKKCVEKFTARYPSAVHEIIDNTLGLANRCGDYFLRVYVHPEKPLELSFELEIKKYKARQLLSFLRYEQFLDFETIVVKSYLRVSKTALILDSFFTDWLTIMLRKTSKSKITPSLKSSYLNKNLVLNSKNDELFFYRFLQFLAFTRTYRCTECKMVTLNSELYRTFKFSLIDFAKEIDLYPLTTYQRNKLIEFFFQCQDLKPISRWFTDDEFRSILPFPVIRIQNQSEFRHSKLIVYITTSDLFFQYNYPFKFPKSFLTYQNLYDLRAKLSLVKVISQDTSTRKELYIQKILINLNNQNRTSVENSLILSLKDLRKNKLIENTILLESSEGFVKEILLEQLNRQLLQATDTLIFYEIIS